VDWVDFLYVCGLYLQTYEWLSLVHLPKDEAILGQTVSGLYTGLGCTQGELLKLTDE
jgi:hypothetical protein